MVEPKEYQVALIGFLTAVLAQRVDRLVGFASSPRTKTQRKVIDLVYHELASLLKQEAVVASLPDKAWNSRSFLFCNPLAVGMEFATMRQALDHPQGDRERLVVTGDGKYGCLSTELNGHILVAVPDQA